MTTADPSNAHAARGVPDRAGPGSAAPAADMADEHSLGPHAAAILATEHWSLLASRSLIWNEAMSRAAVFLTVLSASIIALALLADATGFGAQTTTLALVLLPVVLLLGIATYVRLVQINTEEFQLVLAMNRLRRAYLTIAPGLQPYFHHRPPRRRKGSRDHLYASPPYSGAAVAALLGKHANHRCHCGCKPGGDHRRAAAAGRRGTESRACGRRCGGVPGGVGHAVSDAAVCSSPAPRRDAQVPDATGEPPRHFELKKQDQDWGVAGR